MSYEDQYRDQIKTILDTGKWSAYIGNEVSTIYLGQFGTKEEAVRERQLAESGLGYHENHGRLDKL